jgi:hypothetical protein
MKYQIKLNKSKIVGLIILTFFVIFLAFNSGKNPNYEFTTLKTAPEEYWKLFPGSVNKKISVFQSLILKDQNPVSEFDLDNKKYFIQVVKLETSTEQSLNDFLTLSNSKELSTNAMTYYPIGHFFAVFYKTGKNKISHINFNLIGDSVRTILRNDTIACFYSNFKLFSMNYGDSDKTAIYSNSDRADETPLSGSSLPIEIVFLKRNDSIYFLLMSVNDFKTKMEPRQLYNLIYARR